MTYTHILVDTTQGVGQITLNRPAVGNALNSAMLQELEAVLRQMRQDQQVRALLLTGSGTTFCTGGDASDSTLAGQMALFNRIVLALAELDKPVIVAVNGPVVGAGCSLVLASDVILASEEASFGDLLTQEGPLPDVGGSHFLPRLVGEGRARELTALPGPIDASLADKYGMVNRVVAAGELTAAARALAEKVAAGPPVAMMYAKRIMNRAFEMTLEENLETEALAQNLMMQTEDHQEGARSFLEKRAPVFTGR